MTTTASAGDAVSLRWGLAGLVVGVCSATLLGPLLAQTPLGTQPQTAWFLSRALGLGAYTLFWASTVLGLLITSKTSRLWPGGPAAFDVHQFSSLAALGIATAHALVLLGDAYMSFSLRQLLLPFAAAQYERVWTGLGQTALLLGLLVGLSCYVRKRLGQRLWRTLHYLAFAVYSLLLLHAILAGTDSGRLAVMAWYVASGALVYWLLLYRILSAPKPAAKREVAPAGQPHRSRR